ncbi:septum formation protein Maf [Maribius pontilimi]|uniref:dTTP/UTP pyrophosphatase n=1 Tax=Palleronia pontilimi TaxID=1964209 RepID=A0A934MDU1_9RHOB|nr:Maf family protein [Palleronia pontilimi]MBJ3763845.1 septum formation protein Maf [Palleronia pontilimi]
MSSDPRLVLGSGSPRRLELLAQLGLVPADIRAPEIDETPHKGELPRPYCARMALEKARALDAAPGEVLLTADTTVAAGRRILGKPEDEDQARAFLSLLSGRRHRVHTSIVVRADDRTWSRDVESQVKMKVLSQADIDRYIATDDWRGKAGGYAIQGPAAAFIPWMQGSFTAVVGLPLHETAQLLEAAGLPVWGRA